MENAMKLEYSTGYNVSSPVQTAGCRTSKGTMTQDTSVQPSPSTNCGRGSPGKPVRRWPPGPVITMELTWMSVQPLQSNATAVARLEVPLTLRLLYVTLLIATAACNANPEDFSWASVPLLTVWMHAVISVVRRVCASSVNFLRVSGKRFRLMTRWW